jgi:hypothetical protein
MPGLGGDVLLCDECQKTVITLTTFGEGIETVRISDIAFLHNMGIQGESVPVLVVKKEVVVSVDGEIIDGIWSPEDSRRCETIVCGCRCIMGVRVSQKSETGWDIVEYILLHQKLIWRMRTGGLLKLGTLL